MADKNVEIIYQKKNEKIIMDGKPVFSVRALLYIFMVLSLLFDVAFFHVNCKAEEYTDENTVKIVQSFLNEKEYDCGTVDGICGKKTRNAILQYEKKQNLTEDGLITDTLLESMQIDDNVRKGTVIPAFVERYNEAAEYFNSLGTGSISLISEETVKLGEYTPDGMSVILFLNDDNNIVVKTVVLMKKDNSFDMTSVYELASCGLGLDRSYTNLTDAINNILQYVEGHNLETDIVTYGMYNYSDKITFVLSTSK